MSFSIINESKKMLNEDFKGDTQIIENLLKAVDEAYHALLRNDLADSGIDQYGLEISPELAKKVLFISDVINKTYVKESKKPLKENKHLDVSQSMLRDEMVELDKNVPLLKEYAERMLALEDVHEESSTLTLSELFKTAGDISSSAGMIQTVVQSAIDNG